MKTILVTGSTGFLGSYLVKKIQKKYNLICLGFKQIADYRVDLIEKKKNRKDYC